MKVPVMLGIFEAVSRGELRLDQPVRVRNEFVSILDGSSYALDPKEDSDSPLYELVVSGQEHNNGIPAGLPKGTRVAHKTGSITAIGHDAGLVFTDDGSSYALVILTRGFRKQREAEKVIASASRAVWRWRVQKALVAERGPG